MYKSIYLKKGKEESLKRFHPWVFSGAISHFAEKGEIEEGEVVRVLTNEGEFIEYCLSGMWKLTPTFGKPALPQP